MLNSERCGELVLHESEEAGASFHTLSPFCWSYSVTGVLARMELEMADLGRTAKLKGYVFKSFFKMCTEPQLGKCNNRKRPLYLGI